MTLTGDHTDRKSDRHTYRQTDACSFETTEGRRHEKEGREGGKEGRRAKETANPYNPSFQFVLISSFSS